MRSLQPHLRVTRGNWVLALVDACDCDSAPLTVVTWWHRDPGGSMWPLPVDKHLGLRALLKLVQGQTLGQARRKGCYTIYLTPSGLALSGPRPDRGANTSE